MKVSFPHCISCYSLFISRILKLVLNSHERWIFQTPLLNEPCCTLLNTLAFSKSSYKFSQIVHAGHFPCHVRHHVLTMFEWSDITSDKVSRIKSAHTGNFQFHVRHVPRGPHIWRTLNIYIIAGK